MIKDTKILNSVTIASVSEKWAAEWAADIGEQIEQMPVKDRGFSVIPSSQIIHLMCEFIIFGDSIAELPERKAETSHGAKYTVNGGGNYRELKYTTREDEISISTEMFQLFCGRNCSMQKLLMLILSKISEKAVHSGTLGSAVISFPLSELIEQGIYDTPQSARRGFKNIMTALQSLKTRGTLHRGKKNEIKFDGVLFVGKTVTVKTNQCVIALNQLFEWKCMSEYHTILPDYAYKLSPKAFSLLYYTLYIARQQPKCTFNVSIKAIQNHLRLPRYRGKEGEILCRRPQEKIVKPIEDAVELIETYEKKTGSIQFLFVGEDGKIGEFLDNGYLKVTLSGEYKQYMQSHFKTREKRKRQHIARQKRAKEARNKQLKKNT